MEIIRSNRWEWEEIANKQSIRFILVSSAAKFGFSTEHGNVVYSFCLLICISEGVLFQVDSFNIFTIDTFLYIFSFLQLQFSYL